MPHPVVRSIMSSNVDGARRHFVLAGCKGAATVLATGLGGCAGATSGDRQLRFDSLAAAEEELARLARAKELGSGGSWTWPQTLVHCAQSIEYSMTGFPQSKSRLFQETIGSLAFGAFSWRGRMTHDLSEPIPGAPVLDATLDAAQALERLRAAVATFSAWSRPLRAHFAYGELTRQQYDLAHAMHLANHLSAFRVEA